MPVPVGPQGATRTTRTTDPSMEPVPQSTVSMSRKDADQRYEVRVASSESELAQAQRLRHQVFAGEWGARLPHTHLDADALDPWCDHLIVVDLTTDSVVGTYRLLPPDRAAVAGGSYCAGEFDLTNIGLIAADLVELGRSCVHPQHRTGAVIGLLWAGVLHYLVASGHRWLMGATSVPLSDSGIRAANVWFDVSRKSLCPPEYAVTPRQPWVPDPNTPELRSPVPPLMRGYLRLGAWVCGPPAHDPDFDCADFLMLMDLQRISERKFRLFTGRSR